MGPFLVHGLRAVFLGVPFRDDCLKCCVYFTFLFVVYVSHCCLNFFYQFLYIVLGFHSGEKIFPIPIPIPIPPTTWRYCMGGFFFGAKYVEMGIFWNLYLWV